MAVDCRPTFSLALHCLDFKQNYIAEQSQLLNGIAVTGFQAELYCLVEPVAELYCIAEIRGGYGSNESNRIEFPYLHIIYRPFSTSSVSNPS